ncbi:MAG: indolepyruvate oxidoreductase subunit beta [Thermacetogeniaceae bacterium]|jgi:indolepyruvate ferredoxin oxidoreductase beta subunit
MTSEPTSVIIAGVGGQGIILASRILSMAALKSGHQVKVAETHGMAQRGGSVITHLRYGSTVYSPLISAGQADYLIGFEKLEAVRCLPFIKEDGLLIINDQEIPPLPVLLGKLPYPELTGDSLRGSAPRLQFVPARACAQQLGDSRAVNMVLLGCLARYLQIARECWQMAIDECVRPQYQELDRQAFLAGLNFVVGG